MVGVRDGVGVWVEVGARVGVVVGDGVFEGLAVETTCVTFDEQAETKNSVKSKTAILTLMDGLLLVLTN
jgi:hypothetical protein